MFITHPQSYQLYIYIIIYAILTVKGFVILPEKIQTGSKSELYGAIINIYVWSCIEHFMILATKIRPQWAQWAAPKFEAHNLNLVIQTFEEIQYFPTMAIILIYFEWSLMYPKKQENRVWVDKKCNSLDFFLKWSVWRLTLGQKHVKQCQNIQNG